MQKSLLTLSFLVISLSVISCGRSLKRVEEADVHFRASKSLYAKGETIQSLAEAQNAEKIDDSNEEIQNFLGLLFAERGDTEKAKAHFAKAVKIKPDYSEAQNNLCAFQLQDGKYDEAIKHCQKAIENVTYATPERAYNNMAMAYEKKGDLTMAEKMHRNALIHNKKFVFSLLYLGRTAYDKKDYKQAKEMLKNADDACVISPKGSWGLSCPESQYRLALTYLQIKDTPQAVSAFQHCVDSDISPTNEFKEKCAKNLKMYK
jgi:type IV pilus assembly protein PilF